MDNMGNIDNMDTMDTVDTMDNMDNTNNMDNTDNMDVMDNSMLFSYTYTSLVYTDSDDLLQLYIPPHTCLPQRPPLSPQA